MNKEKIQEILINKIKELLDIATETYNLIDDLEYENQELQDANQDLQDENNRLKAELSDVR